MAPHGVLETISFQVRPGKSSSVQQHLPDVFGESIAIPDPKMGELVPAKKEPFQVQRREHMIDSSDPLGHPVVIRIFCFDRKFDQSLRERSVEVSYSVSAEAAVRRDPREIRIPIRYQS
jgi:hypothetical protein